ncbi:unnamed protein product, partial [Discosporangium mesarthrocarpum]
MQSLKDTALEDAGTGSTEGGLGGDLFGGIDDLPDFFKNTGLDTSVAGLGSLGREELAGGRGNRDGLLGKQPGGLANSGDGDQGGVGALDADQSSWTIMQKQFEDLNKSFLKDYNEIQAGGAGGLDTLGSMDDGQQAAFATMRQLSLDDIDSSL